MNFFKVKSSDMPTKPKPTDILPDNLMYVWDPNANDWIILQKDTNKATPPLYDPNNQNVTNQTISYMGNIKSASSEIVDKNGKKTEEGMWLYKPIIHSTFRGGIPLRLFQVKIRHQKDGTDKPYLLSENKLITKGISHIKDGILFDTYEEAKQYSESHKTKEEKEFDKLDDWQKTDYYLNKQSSCLSKFLDGPRYSKEIKIEAGLIKEGLVKYAGFDFNRGTKYTITTKGLEILRKASETEHNEALNEREKLAYMFGFNTDKVSTLDTTGKVIKSDELSKCEWCGEEFDESELEDTELGKVCYRCKKGIESKEGPMNNKNISEAKQYLEKYLLENPELFKYQYGKDNVEEVLKELIEENPNWYKKFSSKKWTICEADGTELGEVEADSELNAKVKFGIEHPEYADSQSICAKEINAQYEQTTNTKEPYPNPSETPNDHIVLENHDGWVNTAEQKVTPEFAKLHKLLGEYKKQSLITLTDLDGNLVATGDPQIINELEHQVKALGYHCEAVDEYTDSDYAETYSLKIFMK